MKYDLVGGNARIYNGDELSSRIFTIKDNTNLKYIQLVLHGEDHSNSYQDIINKLESKEVDWKDPIEFTEENFLKELNW